MVDTLVLGTNGEIREGSSPFTCTNIINYRVYFDDCHHFCTPKGGITKAIVVGRNVLVHEYLMPSKFKGGVLIHTTSSVVYKVRYYFNHNDFIDISVSKDYVFGTREEAIRARRNGN